MKYGLKSMNCAVLVTVVFCGMVPLYAENSTVLEDVSATQTWVLSKLKQGKVADFSDLSKDPEGERRANQLTAAELMGLLVHVEKNPQLIPAGFRIGGAVISGDVDVFDLQFSKAVVFNKCEFQGSVAIRSSTFTSALKLNGSSFSSTLTIEDVSIGNFSATQVSVAGDMNLYTVDCRGSCYLGGTFDQEVGIYGSTIRLMNVEGVFDGGVILTGCEMRICFMGDVQSKGDLTVLASTFTSVFSMNDSTFSEGKIYQSHFTALNGANATFATSLDFAFNQVKGSFLGQGMKGQLLRVGESDIFSLDLQDIQCEALDLWALKTGAVLLNRAEINKRMFVANSTVSRIGMKGGAVKGEAKFMFLSNNQAKVSCLLEDVTFHKTCEFIDAQMSLLGLERCTFLDHVMLGNLTGSSMVIRNCSFKSDLRVLGVNLLDEAPGNMILENAVLEKGLHLTHSKMAQLVMEGSEIGSDFSVTMSQLLGVIMKDSQFHGNVLGRFNTIGFVEPDLHADALLRNAFSRWGEGPTQFGGRGRMWRAVLLLMCVAVLVWAFIRWTH